jgi:hypothetical protein
MSESEIRRQKLETFKWYSIAVEYCVIHADRLLDWAHHSRDREFLYVVDKHVTIDPRFELQELQERYSGVVSGRGRYHALIVEQGARVPFTMYGMSGVNFHELGERLAERVLDAVAEAIGSELFTSRTREGRVDVYIPGWELFLGPITFGNHRPFVETSGLPCVPDVRDGTTVVRERLRGVLLDIQDRLTAGIKQERLLVLNKMSAEQPAAATSGDMTIALRDSTLWAVEELKLSKRVTEAANAIRAWRKPGKRFPGTGELAEQLGIVPADITRAIAAAADLREWTESPFRPEDHLQVVGGRSIAFWSSTSTGFRWASVFGIPHPSSTRWSTTSAGTLTGSWPTLTWPRG